MGSLNRCRMFDSSGRRSFLIAGKQLHEIPVQVSDERDPQSGLGCVAGRPNRAAARLHTRLGQSAGMSPDGEAASRPDGALGSVSAVPVTRSATGAVASKS